VTGCNIQQVEQGYHTIAAAAASYTTAGSLQGRRHKGDLTALGDHSSPTAAAGLGSSCWEDYRIQVKKVRRGNVYPPIDQGEPKRGEDRLGAHNDVLQSALREVQAGAPMMRTEEPAGCLHRTRCGSLDHIPQPTPVATLGCLDSQEEDC